MLGDKKKKRERKNSESIFSDPCSVVFFKFFLTELNFFKTASSLSLPPVPLARDTRDPLKLLLLLPFVPILLLLLAPALSEGGELARRR